MLLIHFFLTLNPTLLYKIFVFAIIISINSQLIDNLIIHNHLHVDNFVTVTGPK